MNTPNPKAMLQSWLEEWTLWQSMREETVPEPLSWNPSLDFSNEPRPAPGDIRLWPARDSRDPPFYGVLLAGDYGTWRVVPFSPFATPATPGEWRAREHPPLRVLQGWNARTITRRGVESAWKADTLDAPVLWTLNLFLTACETEGPPPGDLRLKTGPPLLHPLDPRHVYLDEESERTERALGEFLVLPETQSPLKLAAEPETEWGKDQE